MKLVRNSLVVCSMLLFAMGASAIGQQAQTDVYFASQIWTGEGEPVQNGAMVVVDGVITAVGPRDEVSIPAVAQRHELGANILIPGLVVVQSDLGGTQTEERTITPQIRALDGFDFFEDRTSLLESGLTTVQVSPARNRLMPGVGGVVKLAGKKMTDRILQEEESLQLVLSSASRQPPRIYEPAVGPVSEDRPLNATRPQVATLSASMATLRQILKAATSDSPSDDEVVSAVARLIKAKKPLRITATTAPEIRGAVSLAKEFKLKIVLTDCVGLDVFKDVLPSWKPFVAGVILTAGTPGAISNPTIEQLESQKQPWQFARELMDAGIPVAIAPQSRGQLGSTMFVAGQFMRDGVSASELLSSLTSTPAAILNVSDHVGMLANGKQADFVVLSGQPFAMHTRVQATYVSGEKKFERKLAPQTTVVSADRIYVGDGHYLDGGQVVVKGKTIRGVGASVSSPSEANFRHFENAVVVPGFVDMGTGLGLGGPASGGITLATKLGEQLYPDDPAIEYARKNGITTALLVANAGAVSPVVAFKLGDDARVIGDPVALKFRMSGSTAAAVSSAEKQLAAGKKYVDSWKKYETDLKEYETKVKEEEAKAKAKPAAKPEAKKEAEKKTSEKKPAETKKPVEKKESDKDKEKPVKDKPVKDEKKDGEGKDGDKDKEQDKDKEKKKVLPDPITGTWEGEIDMERLPPQFRAFNFELVLEKDDSVTGSVTMMRQDVDISDGSYDRKSRELAITIERRGRELEISGTLDENGDYEATMEFGPAGEVKLTAKRTVDKSKKPEPEDDKKDPEKKDPEKKDKEEKKDKPESGDDKDKEKDKKEKPADKDKKEPAKKPETKEAEKKETKAEEKKPEAKKTTLKAPKKPSLNAALEPYKALFEGKIPAFVEVRDLFTIEEAAKLFAEKYKLKTVIVGADGLARKPDALAKYDVSVITGPQFSVAVPKQFETANMPQLLANERLPFAFQSNGTTGSGQLPNAIQYSVSRGLSTVDALHGLTSAPAKMLSDDSKFGTIRSGHDADLIVLSGPPFEFSTKILAVMIDGVWVYEREEEK